MDRKLRIAVSVFFGLLTVALCVLWVRSYWVSELLVTAKTPTAWSLGPIRGGLLLGTYPQGTVNNWREWYLASSPSRSGTIVRSLRFSFDFSGDTKSMVVPFWFLIGATCAFWMPLSWPTIRPQFSLRTLLIATTLVAVVLGLAAWVAR